MLQPIIEILRLALETFNNYVNSYGWSIILLTVVIKIVLLPLTIKQNKSMKAMSKIQPKLKALQEKYKDDKERLNKEIMSFYKENKVNPLAGCFPLLLQLPVMFALFRMLTDPGLSKIISKEGFFWIKSLTDKDPILVVVMLATTFAQQLMMTTDPQQKNMMLPMTIFMGIIAFNFPAGVLLYWVTMNVLTILQQYVQNLITDRKPGGKQDQTISRRKEVS